MGRSLIIQKRGKGGPVWRATHRAKADINYITLNEMQKTGHVEGQVVKLTTDPIRTGILAEILLENGEKTFMIAAEGIRIGQRIQLGLTSEIAIGNVLPLMSIPEGCPIFAIEKIPGDGGQLVRSSGSYALVVTKDKDKGKVFIKLPSGKSISLNGNCRATIGNVCAGGRKDKPFVKAGNKYHYMKAKSKKYPKIRGVAMNPVSHPFGGSQHHTGKSKSTSRHAPAGRKVGAIASKRTGRKKK